ncbi:MAG: type I methionyl aminopeptidase [Thermodesulfovibrio sp.]|nr:type I methionyl aminopeptidase [Thermodesulfovibrio sp.]
MIIIKSQAEINKIAAACRIVAEVLGNVKSLVTAGVSTAEIEAFAEAQIRNMKAIPAFKGYRGYPASICVSLNDQVVHGIPSPKVKLKNGDIVSVDLGVLLDGFYGDGAMTIPVGDVSGVSAKLIRVTEEALYAGIEKSVIGNRVSDISAAIQQHVEANGFSVVRAFVGHGIGRSLHEEPQVPNFGRPGQGSRLKEGMTLAIEPMVNTDSPDVKILDDGWTAVTADGGLSAHFEHTIVITKKRPKILTKF